MLFYEDKSKLSVISSYLILLALFFMGDRCQNPHMKNWDSHFQLINMKIW